MYIDPSVLANPLPDFDPEVMAPIRKLLFLLKIEDRKPAEWDALLATADILQITPQALFKRINDRKQVTGVMPELIVQAKLSVGAQQFVYEQNAKLERWIDAYLYTLNPDNALFSKLSLDLLREAVRDSVNMLTLSGEISDDQLDGDKQSLLHRQITGYLFAHIQEKKFEEALQAQDCIEAGTLLLQPPISPSI